MILKLIPHVCIMVSVIAVTACASKETRQIASGKFDYLEAKTESDLSIPEGLDSPSKSREYEIPNTGGVVAANKKGSDLKVVSPRLILPIVSGSQVEEGVKSAAIKFDQINDDEELRITLWSNLVNFLKDNQIDVRAWSEERGIIETEWFMQSQTVEGDWYQLNDQVLEVNRRFEIKMDMAAHGRTGAISTRLLDYEKYDNGNNVETIDGVFARNEEVEFLNEFVRYYEYQIGLYNQRLLANIKRGLEVTMGFNPDGDPAYVVDGKYDVVWPRLLLVLRSLNFDVKDLDKTNGILFVSYNGTDGGWWTNVFSSDEELVKADDYRLSVMASGPKTAVTFMSDESVPFAANEVALLFDAFAAAMANDNLDI